MDNNNVQWQKDERKNMKQNLFINKQKIWP